MRKALFAIISCCLFIRLIYMVYGIAYHSAKTEPSPEVLAVFNKADAGWYENIFNEGYPHVTQRDSIGLRNSGNSVQSAWAFFPGYPYTVKGFAALLQSGFNTAALVAGFIFSVTFFFLLFLFLKTRFSPQTVLYIMLVMALFPFHFFYGMFYSEAYFMSALLASLLLMERRKYFFASACLALMVMIRSSGMALLPVVFLFALHMEGFTSHRQFGKMVMHAFRNWTKYLLLFMLPLLAFGAWCYYQWIATGFWNAFSIAQEGWYHKLRFPLLSLFRGGDWQNQFLSWYTVAFLAAAAIMFRKLVLYEKVWVVIGLLFPLTFGSVISMPRYISIVLPLFIFFGEKITVLKSRDVIIAIMFLLQLVTFYFWLKGDPICY